MNVFKRFCYFILLGSMTFSHEGHAERQEIGRLLPNGNRLLSDGTVILPNGKIDNSTLSLPRETPAAEPPPKPASSLVRPPNPTPAAPTRNPVPTAARDATLPASRGQNQGLQARLQSLGFSPLVSRKILARAPALVSAIAKEMADGTPARASRFRAVKVYRGIAAPPDQYDPKRLPSFAFNRPWVKEPERSVSIDPEDAKLYVSVKVNNGFVLGALPGGIVANETYRGGLKAGKYYGLLLEEEIPESYLSSRRYPKYAVASGPTGTSAREYNPRDDAVGTDLLPDESVVVSRIALAAPRKDISLRELGYGTLSVSHFSFSPWQDGSDSSLLPALGNTRLVTSCFDGLASP